MQDPATIGPTPRPAWAEALKRNDPRVARELYAAHWPAVRQFVLGNSGTLPDAQDMFQEAFLVLWMQVKEGRFTAGDGEGPGGFLFQVAKHKWLDVVRSAARKHMQVVHNERLQVAPETAADGTEARLERLRAVYATLDEKCRKVLDRFYHGREDLATIATAMGVEEESIRTIKYRCMMKLRAHRRTIGGEENNTQ